MKSSQIIATGAAASLALIALWQFSENRTLQQELSDSNSRIAGLQQQVDSLESNLQSARVQLERFSASLQEAREQLNDTAPLRTSNDLSSQLFGKQPPSTSVAPPPGYQTARPPGSSMDMARQMAEMQANVRYGEFVEGLNLSEEDEAPIRETIAQVFVERVEASRQRSSGAGSSQLERITSSAYLRERLEDVLNNSQLASFDAYEADFVQLQQRNTFSQEINRYAPELTAANRELVLETVLQHLGLNSQTIDQQADATTETQRQLMGLTMARQELMGQLDQGQMMEANKFLNRVQSGMVQSQTMNEGLDVN